MKDGSGSSRPGSATWICVSLLLLVAGAFADLASHDFVVLDDPLYLFSYPQVREGLTLRGIRWAFGATAVASWQPLTWISHIVDWELYEGWAGGHHLTSLALHASSTILLFLALQRLTASRWRSAFVAAVFAVHPMHVEPVAWVAARQHLLCGFFWVISLYSYARFVESRSAVSYASLLIAHALCLMAKTMGVTLPFVLLLLDYWPLGRLRIRGAIARAEGRHALEPRPARVLVLEKLPLFALSAASIAIALTLQESGDLRTLAQIPFGARIGNASVAYASYVAKTLWPTNLAVLYPHPVHWPLWQVAGSLLTIAAITFAVVRAYRRRSYLTVGWLWFVGTLIPVIGLIQRGDQSHADRYTYLPTIGLSIMAAWALPPLAARWRLGPRALGFAAAAVTAVLALATHAQLRVWRDTGTLWTHAVEVTSNNYIAHANLGSWLTDSGRVQQGLAHARRAVEIAPEEAHAHYNLGALLLIVGDEESAEQPLRRALAIQPDHVQARLDLASVLDSLGRSAEAVVELERILAAMPGHSVANENLGYLRERQGDPALALRHYRRALETEPGQSFALRRAAHILATARDPALRDADEAIRLAERACSQNGYSDARDLDTLAAAYALAGRVDQAVATAHRAANLARKNRQPRLAAAIAERAELYSAGGVRVE